MKLRLNKASILRAYPVFHNRNYRLYFYGQLVSYAGNWLQIVALGWLVLQETHSAYWVGVVYAVPYFVSGLLTPIGGMITDRLSKKKILYTTQILGLVQAVTLGSMALTHHANILVIGVLAFFLGLINAVDGPARVTFATEIVEPQQVGVVTAMNGAMQTSAQVFGPGLAGFLIALVGSGWTFMINGATFLVVIMMLLLIKTMYLAEKQNEHPLKMFWSGVKYTTSESKILSCTIIGGLVAMFGYSFAAILPVMTTDIFKAGPQTLGYLGSSAGIGACLGALIISAKSKNRLPFGLYIIGGALTTGIALVLLAQATHEYLAMPALFFAGFGFTLSFATTRSESQVISEKRMRGRVAGLTITTFFLGIALGNYLIGYLAERFNIAFALEFNGSILVILAIFTYLILDKIDKEPLRTEP